MMWWSVIRRVDQVGGVGCSALGAATPVDDFCLVDLEAVIIGGGEAGRVAHGAIDVEQRATTATDEVMVVVAGTVFVARRRPSGLDASEERLVGERGQGVVHRLPRDRSDAGPNRGEDVVGGGVRMGRHGPKHSDALSGDVETVTAQELVDAVGHGTEHT